ncbi:MAG: GNAT family N-acetyltransferase [Thermoplasmata archaeon]|nr:GNAT family N-acetyltransferase [Thermoplasmata archaeon]
MTRRPTARSHGKLTIRSAAPEEFLDCVRIAHRAWPSFQERNSIYHLFTKYFAGTSLVARVDGRVVGFTLGFLAQSKKGVGYIHLVATDPSAQRRGIAHQLYLEMFRRFRALGCRKVRCIINPENARSLAFHDGMGFRPEHSGPRIRLRGVWATRDYNGKGIHMVEMTRGLRGAGVIG